MNIEIVQQILASDIINWFLAFVGGALVFKIVDHMQTNIERHTVIKELESSINELFSRVIAKSNKGMKKTGFFKKTTKIYNVNFRTVLHDETPWKTYNKSETIIDNGQRYVCIRKDYVFKEYVSTQALHESLIIFRRIEKLYKDSIIKPIDLADLWRELLPFCASKRIEFYRDYFSENDVQTIVFVLFNTFLACRKFKIENAVKYFCDSYNLDKNTSCIFIKNSRYRLTEKLKIRRFIKSIQ